MTSLTPYNAKILIVDDQDTNLLLFERVLKKGGYTHYRSIIDSRQAISAYLEFQPDLVLLDLSMPYLDGVGLIEQLRPLAAGTYLPIVVLTADVSPEAKQRALAAGATDFLTKPFDAVEVLLRIRNLLETRTLYQQLERRSEIEVRTARQRLEHVVASSPAVLFTLTIAENQIRGISWISDNLQEFLGYVPEVAADSSWWLNNIHPDERERIIAQTHADLFSHGHATHEYRFRHRDGSYRWTRGELRLMHSHSGGVEIVGSWSDITERKLLEDQLRQSQKMEAVGRLAGGVAHDFNNLLTVINGYGDIVLESLPEGNASRAMVREIKTAGERATSLTRQLLAFTRQQTIAPRVIDLNDLLQNAERMLLRLIGEDIYLVRVSATAPARIMADPSQIEQIILNLAVNARDAMPRGGKLIIETRTVEKCAIDKPSIRGSHPHGYVLLSVSDTGCGMDDGTKSRIFEPFFTTKGEHGTGLGLATVYGIVNQAGGFVEVDSSVGLGTTFRIYFPQEAELSLDCEPDPRHESIVRGNETILLVEDEAGVRTLTRRMLEDIGYTILEAALPQEAIRVCEQYPGAIHLLVTDVVMPEKGGRELADLLIAKRSEMRVLFVSGYTDEQIVRCGVAHAEVAFLQKPYAQVDLARKVREALVLPYALTN